MKARLTDEWDGPSQQPQLTVAVHCQSGGPGVLGSPGAPNGCPEPPVG